MTSAFTPAPLTEDDDGSPLEPSEVLSPFWPPVRFGALPPPPPVGNGPRVMRQAETDDVGSSIDTS